MALVVTVVDKDTGLKRIEEDISLLDKVEIWVGIQEGTKTRIQSRKKRKQKAGVSIAQYGAYNEYGTRHIPQRSFIRSSFDENMRSVTKFLNRQYGLVIDGKKTVKEGAGAVGQLVQDNIKKKIREIVSPPNSPKTIKMKKSSKPLIDFGQLFASIRYVLATRKRM